MEFLIIIVIIAILSLAVMWLKKIFRLRVEDQDYSDKNDYLERRVKKDEEDN